MSQDNDFIFGEKSARTVGQLKAMLAGIPDWIPLAMSDGESYPRLVMMGTTPPLTVTSIEIEPGLTVED